MIEHQNHYLIHFFIGVKKQQGILYFRSEIRRIERYIKTSRAIYGLMRDGTSRMDPVNCDTFSFFVKLSFFLLAIGQQWCFLIKMVFIGQIVAFSFKKGGLLVHFLIKIGADLFISGQSFLFWVKFKHNQADLAELAAIYA